MDKFTNCDRTFYRHTKAFYANVVSLPSGAVEEVMFGYTHHEGGTPGEIAMRWIDLGGRSVPRLECFDDGFASLASFGDVLASLAEVDGVNMTPDEFCAVLLAHGFKDKTATTPR
jgi:hypothetical protein